MSQTARVTRLLVEALAKHLPPSAATLKLIDVGGAAGAILAELRGDLDIRAVDAGMWRADENSADAVVAVDQVIDAEFLAEARRALRPGGRLIAVMAVGYPSETHVRTLEDAGYTRILVEHGADSPLPIGVLMRGEKPHETDDTLTRVRVAADVDTAEQDMATYQGRYVHLLIRQTPNKPVWAMRADEDIVWDAAAVGDVLLAFTSLPRAVSFMQPAVLSGWIEGVNKVVKFKREVIADWAERILLNPALERIAGLPLTFRPVDPNAAEQPDE